MLSPAVHEQTSSSHQDELNSYINKPAFEEDALAFRKENAATYPTLVQLAQKYIPVPASSVPVERIFSVAGQILHPERAVMSDTTFETQMFVKCNKAFQ